MNELASLMKNKRRMDANHLNVVARLPFAGAGIAIVIALLMAGGICSAQTQGGTVVGWGWNLYGQSIAPAGLGDVIAISAGYDFSIALKSDGSVTGWGSNTDNQNDQAYIGQASPPAGLSNVVAIACGISFTLALKNDGTVVGWGDDSSGQLDIPAGLTNVVAIGAGNAHSLAVKSDGTVVSWGYTADVPADLTNVIAVAGGEYFSLALKNDGSVVRWGGADSSGLSNVVAIAASYYGGEALTSDGLVYGLSSSTPVGQSGLKPGYSNIVAVSTFAYHSLALKNDGTIIASGDDVQGESTVPNGLSHVIAIAAGGQHSLAVVGNGQVTIMQQPVNRTLFSGGTASFSVGAVGNPPLSYQWQLNGTNIIGATNSIFTITNAQIANDGCYRAVVTGPNNSVTSASAVLAIQNTAPIIKTPPTNQIGWLGLSAAFNVGVVGSTPVYCQWQFNGTNLVGATNFSLTLTNLQFTNQGLYSVVVSNAYGFTNSMGVPLSVLGFNEALNTTNLSWQSGGDLGWVITTNSSHDGVAMAQSGNVAGPQQQSTLQVTVTGPATLKFWWTLYELSYPLSLTFVDNGAVLAQATGPFGWQQKTYYLGAGSQNLKWIFTNGYSAQNLNWGGLDQVNIAPGGTAPLISASTGNQTKPAGSNITFSVTAVGTPPLYYQWLLNSNSIVGATNSSLILTNVQSGDAGIYSVQISNDFGVTNSTNAFLTVSPSAPFILTQPTNQWVLPGENAGLNLVARGTSPLGYQWMLNGTNLPSATNETLLQSNVQAFDGGKYSVLITNSYGSVTSSIATLTVASVVAWNINNYGQATVPYNLGSATAIAGSQYNSLAVLTNGTMAAWGLGNTGATNIPASLTNVVNAALADSLGLAIKTDGTVGWWGTSTQTNPIPYLSNVVAVSASQGNFYLALQSNGMVTAWGANGYGQTNVPVGLSNVVSIAVGDYHSMALKNDGRVAVWGGNVKGIYGQTNIPVGLSNVVSIAGGNNFSLAVKSDGSVVGWPTNEPNVVMRIPSALTNAISVAAAYNHAQALTRDGRVWEWGTVGTGYLTNLMFFSNATAIACGYYHSLANLNDGTPMVVRHPWSQTFYAGYAATMSTGVVGPGPLSYQWQLNGTNLDGATNYILNLPHLRPADAGAYCLLATNRLGTTISSNATLTVITNPPVLSLQPTNQTIGISSNATFAVSVGAGPIPNTYQWQFNGTNILGATNTILTLTNIQMTHQGKYTAVVDNGYGTTTSSNAYLTVLPDLPTALNATDLAWSTGGTAAWLAQTNTSHDGFAAAQSGLIANNRSSTLQTTVTGPGTLTFWWNFAPLATPYPNTLSVTSSLGNASASINSTAGWQQQNLYLGTGQQTVTWTYSRYLFISAQSTGYVDQVSFTPGSTAPTITSMSPNAYVRANSNVGFFANAYGTPPLAYQWQLNGTNLPNKTNTFLNLAGVQPVNSGIYSVIITNAYGSIATNAALWVGQFALSTGRTNLFLSTNGFNLQLDGILTTNPVVILGSTDLVSWLPLFTNPATTGSIQFLDVSATNLPARFYRARE